MSKRKYMFDLLKETGKIGSRSMPEVNHNLGINNENQLDENKSINSWWEN